MLPTESFFRMEIKSFLFNMDLLATIRDASSFYRSISTIYRWKSSINSIKIIRVMTRWFRSGKIWSLMKIYSRELIRRFRASIQFLRLLNLIKKTWVKLSWINCSRVDWPVKWVSDLKRSSYLKSITFTSMLSSS